MKTEKEEEYTYFKIEFKDWSGEYDFTIVESISDIEDYIQAAETDLDNPERSTQVIITGIAMTRNEYSKWFEENVHP